MEKFEANLNHKTDDGSAGNGRREFLKKSLLAGAGLLLGVHPVGSESALESKQHSSLRPELPDSREVGPEFRERIIDYLEIRENPAISIDLHLRILQNLSVDASAGVVYFSPHPDETASHDKMLQLIREAPGSAGIIVQNHTSQPDLRRYLKLQHQDYSPSDRPHDIYVDPNRIFSDNGMELSLKTMNFPLPLVIHDAIVAELKVVRQKILSIMGLDLSGDVRPELIVALHTNTDGGYGINTYRATAEADSAEVNIKTKQDADYFYLTNNQNIYESLQDGPYSIVWEHMMKDDGSMAYYCDKIAIPYLNVETQDGDRIAMGQMIDFARKHLGL